MSVVGKIAKLGQRSCLAGIRPSGSDRCTAWPKERCNIIIVEQWTIDNDYWMVGGVNNDDDNRCSNHTMTLMRMTTRRTMMHDDDYQYENGKKDNKYSVLCGHWCAMQEVQGMGFSLIIIRYCTANAHRSNDYLDNGFLFFIYLTFPFSQVNAYNCRMHKLSKTSM